MTTWTRAVQMIETAGDSNEADAMFAFLRSQVDFTSGRIIPPTPAKPGWRVQAFFQDCGHDMPLPDGCRRVIVPSSLPVAA